MLASPDRRTNTHLGWLASTRRHQLRAGDTCVHEGRQADAGGWKQGDVGDGHGKGIELPQPTPDLLPVVFLHSDPPKKPGGAMQHSAVSPVHVALN
jgi:hypothetical protein